MPLAEKVILKQRKKVMKRLRAIRGSATAYDEVVKVQYEAEVHVSNLKDAVPMATLRRAANLASHNSYLSVQKHEAAHMAVTAIGDAASLVPYESLTPYPPADVISAVEYTVCLALNEACNAYDAIWKAQTSVADAIEAKFDSTDLFEKCLDFDKPVYDSERVAVVDIYVTSAYALVRDALEGVATAAIALTTSMTASAAATHLGLDYDIKLSTDVLNNSITLLRQCNLVGHQFNQIASAMNHVFELDRFPICHQSLRVL